jgi:cyclophilin family peptidyl-prolyl cis-trans isomerase
MSDLCPRACENFIQLCNGYRDPETEQTLQYQNCPVHRIVKGGWIQAGDVVDGSGKNSRAVVDPSGRFADESYSMDFGFARGGLFGYANEGTHTNRSQFFITLAPCGWMNNKFVGFARVVQGFSVLAKLNNLPTSNQTPLQTVRIGACRIGPAENAPATFA